MTDETPLSRRTMMKAAGATTGLLATGTLAGCSSIPFIGGASYTEWIPDPGEFKETDALFTLFQNNKKIAENEDSFDDDTWDDTEQDVDDLDIDFEDISMQVSAGPFTVYDGDYEEQTVIDALEDDGTGPGAFEEDDTYEGYAVYISEDAGDDPTTAYGVSGTKVVRTRSSGDNNAVDVLEIVIDTKTGNGTRFVDENEDYKAVTDELGSGTIVYGRVRDGENESDDPDSGEFEGEVASGIRISINGDTSEFKGVVVFDSESDVDEGDLEDWADNSLDDSYNPDDYSVGTSGRIGTVTFSFDTDEL